MQLVVKLVIVTVFVMVIVTVFVMVIEMVFVIMIVLGIEVVIELERQGDKERESQRQVIVVSTPVEEILQSAYIQINCK